MTGHKIVTALKKFSNTGVHVMLLHKRGTDEYLIHEEHYDVEITYTPNRWLGLVFIYNGPATSKPIHYGIDTDLYPIGQKDQQQFIEEIEDAIVDFLEKLLHKKVLVGTYQGKSALVVPADKDYFVTTAGRFIESGHPASPKEFDQASKELAPIPIK